MTEHDWLGRVEKEALFLDWERLVGSDNAAASQPVSLEGSLMTIQCRSTAWATQLRLLQDQILARVQEQYPDLGVTDLRFIGPAAPVGKKAHVLFLDGVQETRTANHYIPSLLAPLG